MQSLIDSSLLDTWWAAYYTKFGPIGVPLAIAALLAVYLSVKTYLKLNFTRFQFYRFFREVEHGNALLLFEPKRCSWGRRKNALVRVMHEMVTRHRLHSDDLQSEATFLFHKYFAHTKRSLALLRLVTVASPMLGLLGTVLGIIQVFEVIGSTAGGSSIDNAQLALGIGRALWTTVYGIGIAVPALAAAYYLKQKLFGFVIIAVEYSHRAVDLAEKFEAAERERAEADRRAQEAAGTAAEAPNFVAQTVPAGNAPAGD